MERKGTLHRKDLPLLLDFLNLKGFQFAEQGLSMVVKAKNPKTKKWFIVYDGKSPVHFTVQMNMMGVVRDFLKWKHEKE